MMKAKTPKLSIVIPAYKAAYLDECLQSVCGQDDDSFELIVADDGSPEDLRSIFLKHASRLNTKFVRFDKNLGGSDLISHWNRAVDLASGDWVLLLGDDDLLDPKTVSTFYLELENAKKFYNVYRFNTRKIDEHGELVKVNAIHPTWESSYDFALSRLRQERSSFTCEYIFSKNEFDRQGGFVRLPLGWCSDDATWILLSLKTGICTLDGPLSSWRLSGVNISSFSQEKSASKIRAVATFLAWLHNLYESGPSKLCGSKAEWALITEEGLRWFYWHLWNEKVIVSMSDIIPISGSLVEFSNRSRLMFSMKIVKQNIRIWISSFTANCKLKFPWSKNVEIHRS